MKSGWTPKNNKKRKQDIDVSMTFAIAHQIFKGNIASPSNSSLLSFNQVFERCQSRERLSKEKDENRAHSSGEAANITSFRSIAF